MKRTSIGFGVRTAILLAGFLAAFSACTHAQGSLTWENIAGSTGYDQIVWISGDSLYGTNPYDNLYLSTDGGFSWGEILQYVGSNITGIASNGSHLFVSITSPSLPSAQYRILKWWDQPNVWSAVWTTSTPSYSNIAVDASGRLFVFTFGALETYDGIRWTVRNNNLPFPTLTVSPNNTVIITSSLPVIDNQENLMVGVSQATTNIEMNGLYISADTGATWRQPLSDFAVTAIDGSLAGKLVVGASQLPTVNTTGGVFVSSDSGTTWRGLGLSNHTISAITHDGTGRIFAIADGAVYRYNDSTVQWVQETYNTEPFLSLASLPGNDLIASSQAAGLIRSTDGGDTWLGGQIRGTDVFAITLTDSGEIVAGTLGSGIFRSQFGGGGSSWLVSTVYTGVSDCYSLCRNSGDGTLFGGTEDGVIHSTDRGISWQGSDDTSIIGSAFAVGSLSTGTILAGTEFGVYRSTDDGHHWSSSGIASSKVFFLDVSPSDQILAGTATDGVFISTNGGMSWANIGVVRDDIQAVLTAPSGQLLVGVYGGVFRSTDHGASWNYTQFDESYVYSLVKTATGSIYAGTADNMFESNDGGASWTSAGSSGIPQSPILSLAESADGKLLAGVYRSGIYRTTVSVVSQHADGVGRLPGLPATYSLDQNYPNPFNPSTVIRYSLPQRSFVDLAVFDITGRRVATVVHGEQPPGVYMARWNASAVASGVYFYRLSADRFLTIRKMLLLR